MDEDKKIQNSILEVVCRHIRPITVKTLTEELKDLDAWKIRENIWELTADGKLEITYDWKLQPPQHKNIWDK